MGGGLCLKELAASDLEKKRLKKERICVSLVMICQLHYFFDDFIVLIS